MIKKWQLILICSSIIACIGLGYGYTLLIERFDERNIYSNQSYDSRLEGPHTTQLQLDKIKEILNQNFYYMAKGCQVYAFCSGDQEYVLKLFKCQHLNTKWVEYLPQWCGLTRYQNQLKEKRSNRASLLFNGYKIGFEDLAQETGIIYIHLNKTNYLNQKVTLYNKLGVKYTINLDDVEFVIQKKVQPIQTALTGYIASGNIQKMDQVIAQIVHVLEKRNKKGIRDKDTQLIHNIGVLDGQVKIIDPGQFIKDDTIVEQSASEKDIHRRLQDLHEWLARHHPGLENHCHYQDFNQKALSP